MMREPALRCAHLSHNYNQGMSIIGPSYMGNDHRGHNYISHTYAGPNYMGNNHGGHDYMVMSIKVLTTRVIIIEAITT